MKRALVWMAGSALLGWLCWHFQVWHMLLQLVLVLVTFVWLFAGAWIASRQRREPRERVPSVDRSVLEQQVNAERKHFTDTFGEPAAVAAETANPRVWLDMAWKSIGRK